MTAHSLSLLFNLYVEIGRKLAMGVRGPTEWIYKTVREIVKERKRSGKKQSDLLQLMLDGEEADGGVGHEVRSALARLRTQRVTGVVLDLRGDPGGLLDEAVETASVFLDGGTVVTYTRRDGPTQRLDAVGSGDTSTPLVVLVDGGTASAAEVVAGALQDRGRAVIVGSRTFGKGSVQEPRMLSDGSALELTVARYTTPTGRSLEGVGLEPDIDVAPGSDPAVAETRAVEVLTGLLADAGSATGGRG